MTDGGVRRIGARILVASVVWGCSGRPSPSGTEGVEQESAADRGATVPSLSPGKGPGCAVYAAVAVARYHGYELDPLLVMRSVEVFPDGVSLARVARTLEARGVSVRVGTPSVRTVRETVASGLPVVVGQRRGTTGHALVVQGVDESGDRYRIMDPANPGRRWMSMDEVDTAFERIGRPALLVLPKGSSREDSGVELSP